MEYKTSNTNIIFHASLDLPLHSLNIHLNHVHKFLVTSLNNDDLLFSSHDFSNSGSSNTSETFLVFLSVFILLLYNFSIFQFIELDESVINT
jgi:hypothetical protein